MTSPQLMMEQTHHNYNTILPAIQVEATCTQITSYQHNGHRTMDLLICWVGEYRDCGGEKLGRVGTPFSRLELSDIDRSGNGGCCC